MPVVLRRTLLIVLLAAVVGAVVWAFIPRPVAVDVVEATIAPMQVAIEEDGRTRLKERYVVSAPLAGRLRRIELDPGDEVREGETILAVIEPTDPDLLDVRSQAQAEARVRAAEAAVERAGAELEQAQTAYEFAAADRDRIENVFAQDAATQRELDEARRLERQTAEALRAAQFAQEIAEYELELARSALIHTLPDGADSLDAFRFVMRSPIDGAVLQVFQESVAVVTPGSSLLELGNLQELEIVVDLLSTDAVKVRPGDAVIVDHWGGGQPLEAVVRSIEPAAFTKVSALGVEEQRVNIVADFTTPFEERSTLGDGYRVEAAIVVWSEPEVLQIPGSAAFRRRGEWVVFVLQQDRPRLRNITVGRQSRTTIQVLEGLEAGDWVIVHPPNDLSDGDAIEPRRVDIDE